MAVRPPSERLRPYVREDLVGYAEHTPAPVLRREWPEPYVVVIFEFGPPIRVYEPQSATPAAAHAGGFVAGLGDRYALTEHDGYQAGVQVNLTPLGARRFFGMPMSTLARRVVPLADVLPREHGGTAERLAELDWDARLDLVELILAGRIFSADLDTRVVAWALRRIEETAGAVPIETLARELGYSRKHVITLFRDQVGLAPKRLSRLVRFGRLVQDLRSGTVESWSELAARHGFYDQAHLVKEVKYFTGLTPTQARPLMTDLLAQTER